LEGRFFRKLVISNPALDEINAYLKKIGVLTLHDIGMEKAGEGLTTVEEVERVC